MSRNKMENLIYMANQIAENMNQANDDVRSAQVVADHLTRFWSPQMKAQITDYINEGGSELSAVAISAIKQLRTTRQRN